MTGSLKSFFKELTGAEKILLLLTLLLISVPVFDHLGASSLRRWDESRIAVNAFEMLKSGNIFVVHYLGEPDMWNTKPPLFVWMMSLSMQVFGVNEFAVRFPSAISVIVIFFGGIWFTKKYLGSVYPALLMGLILAVSKGFVGDHTGRTGDYDVPLSMMILGASFSYFLYLRNSESKFLHAFFVFLVLGVWIKGIAACLFLPVLFVLTLLSGKIKEIFQVRNILKGCLAIICILAPYLIREILNPGYINAVWTNEITGRFLEVNEGNSGSFLFYFSKMLEGNFYPWIYLLAPCILIAYWRGDKNQRSLVYFLSVLLAGYFLMLSFSKTKIVWYSAPLYPIMALIVALGLWRLLEIIYNALLPGKKVAGVFIFLIVAALFYEEYTNALDRANPKQYKEYPELKYRNLIRDADELYPNYKRLIIPKFDYNSHTDFYIAAANQEREKIKGQHFKGRFHHGDTLLYSEGEIRDHINVNYVRQILSDRDGRVIALIFAPIRMNNKFYAKFASDGNCTDVAEIYEVYHNNLQIILDDANWFDLVKKKALEKGIPFEIQLHDDAVYILTEQGVLNPDKIQCLNKMLSHTY